MSAVIEKGDLVKLVSNSNPEKEIAMPVLNVEGGKVECLVHTGFGGTPQWFLIDEVYKFTK